MKVLSTITMVAFGIAAAASNVQSAPLYSYDWLTATNPVTVNSDSGMYKLAIIPTPKVFDQTVSQDTQVVNFSLSILPGQTKGHDTFTNKSFNLTLLLDDNKAPASNSSAPMTFKVDFSLDVTNGASTATTIKLTPASQSQAVGGLDFGVGISPFTGQWFNAPNMDNSGGTKGGVNLYIQVADHQGEGQPPSETPEPSSMILACMGLSSLSFAGWRKLRRS